MKIIDNTALEQQLEFIAGVGASADGWLVCDVGLLNAEGGTIVSRAWQIEQALAGVDGAILLEGPGRLTVLAKGKDDIAAACAQGGCSVATADAAPDVLATAKDKLIKAARGGKTGGRSTLYKHRAERQGNIMMVADDDEFICAALKNALGRFGECVAVNDVAGVLDLYLRTSPDCVFMDLHLGDGSGLEAIDAIMAHDRDAHIVMLTSDSKASAATAAKARGAKSFVVKPIVASRVEYELFRSPTFRRYGG